MFDNQISSPWPEWQFVKILGSGSYGVVYEAVRYDHGVASHSAIKQISIPQHASELRGFQEGGLAFDQTKTFLEGVKNEVIGEIEMMETFKGVSNIVSVEDYKVIERTGSVGWDIYIRMELLTPLSRYVSERRMSEQEVINLGIDICTALELCENRNVIHRDIKPANIFVNSFGNYKLGDFGIARKMENLSMGMSYKGTFNYMAPEIAARSLHYDSTVDLYSLGIVLYQFMNGMRLPLCNTGEQALTHTELEAALNRRLSGERLPAPVYASPALSSVILKACEYQPSHRFRTAAQMKAALYAVKQNAASSYRKADRTNRLLTALAGGLAVVVIASLLGAFLLGRARSQESTETVSYITDTEETSDTSDVTEVPQEEQEADSDAAAVTEAPQQPASDVVSVTEESEEEEEEEGSDPASVTEEPDEEEEEGSEIESGNKSKSITKKPEEPEKDQEIHYAVSYDEISPELLDEINQNTIAQLLDRQGGGSGVEVLSYSHYGDLFLAADEETTPHNKLFNIYTAEIRFTDITDGVQYQSVISQIYYRKYKNIMVDPSTGKSIVDVDGSEGPMVSTFELFNADGTASNQVDYQGAHSYEELYAFLMSDEDNSQHYEDHFYAG